jgi:Ca2+-binding EF-hand superfamily protein
MNEQAKREREKELEKQFEKFDENEDGKLTKEEYLESQGKVAKERMDRAQEQRRQGGQRGQLQGRPMPTQRGP